MLGALALAAGFFTLAAPAAHAQVACDHYPSTPLSDTTPSTALNSWPRTKEKDSNPATSSVYNCYPNGSGGTLLTSEFHGLWQGAQNIGHTGTNQPPYYLANLYYQSKTRIYFYKNLTDLNSHWGTNYSVPGGGKFFGRVLRAGDTQNPGVPVGSVGVLREHTDGTVYSLNTIKSTVYHELGHAYDLLVGEPSSYQPGSWYTARNNDIYELNHRTRSYAFSNVSINAECQDMYDSSWDPETQTGTYSNWDVAKCQWPYFTLDQELFANIFGKRAGGILGTTDHPELLEFSIWLGNKFWDETRDYIDAIDY